jgi:hypothetical protein
VTIYASRRADSFTRDSLPWVQEDEQSGRKTRHAERPYYSQSERIRSYWQPRPELTPKTAHPTNPILAKFRREVELQRDADWLSMQSVARSNLERRDNFGAATLSECEHAYRVLTRLANLTKEN